MTKLISERELKEWISDVRKYAYDGEVASYIPALAEQSPESISAGIYFQNGDYVSAGDTNKLFTLQSVSKVISLALALMDNGEEFVFTKVGKEPSGDPFYSIAKLETSEPSTPLNPMINAGALAITSMIHGQGPEEKTNRLLALIHSLTGDEHISYNERVATSEFDTAFLNRSLSYFMKQNGVITGSVEELLRTYTRQCAIELNIEHLSKIGAVFANDGVNAKTGGEVIPPYIAKICKTFMVTCGMYDASGSFAINVGIPAKSGVSGAIMGSVRGFGGIGVFGPSLDHKGNSIVGLHLLKKITEKFNLSIF